MKMRRMRVIVMEIAITVRACDESVGGTTSPENGINTSI